MTVAAPFGTWRSPISAEMVSAGAVSLMQPHLHEGVAYWLEGRPAEGGRSVLVRADAFSEPEDITPSGFNARRPCTSTVAAPTPRGLRLLLNFADQRLYRQDAGGDPVPITPDTGGRDRYADGRVTPTGDRWSASANVIPSPTIRPGS